MAHRALPPRLTADLATAGIPAVTEPDVLAGHEWDWTGHWHGTALGLVRPGDAAAVARTLRLATDHGVPVQIQGGNTGLVGGSVPGPPSLLLGTTALSRVDPVDRLERTVVVGAGVTAAAVARLAHGAGLTFGVDLASRDSATVGGMVATNAGGMGVIAHGPMRRQVRGVRAVLADGRVIDSIGRPAKDNVGYDLTGMLVGSEGTLGVVTDVEIGLHPQPGSIVTGLAGAPDLAAAVALVRRVQDHGARVMAAEVIDAEGLAGACALLGVGDPMARSDAAWAVLIDVVGGSGEGLAPIGEELVVVAEARGERERLWQLRHRQAEVHGRRSGAHLVKLDVAVRLDGLDGLVEAVRAVASQQGAMVGFFGHALDGNLHVQVHPGGSGPPAAATAAASILAEVAARRGSISAEHGLGRQKAPWLERVRAADEVALMRQLKAAVDPRGLLNPGVLLDVSASATLVQD